MRSRATSIFLAGLVLASLTGCTFGAVQSTQQPYDPSDGIGAEIGSVKLLNALLVTDNGEDATLSVTLANDGIQNAAVKVSWETESGDRVERNVYVSAGTAKTIGSEGNTFVLSGIDAELGGLFPVFFQYDEVEGEELMVPVLDGGLEEYTDLVPSE